MWAETISGLKAGGHYHVVGLAAGGDQLIGVRMKTGETALQCSRKNWGETSLNCALQWISFHQVDSLCLNAHSLFPLRPLPSLMRNVLTLQMVAWSHPSCHSLLGVSSRKPSLWILSGVSPPQKVSPTTEFPSQHSTQSISLLFIDLKKIYSLYLSSFWMKGHEKTGALSVLFTGYIPTS